MADLSNPALRPSLSRREKEAERRLGKPKGVVLIICLMLLAIITLLAGTLLLLARTEVTISASARGSVQAMNAAEYGIQLGLNSLAPPNPPVPFRQQTLEGGVRVTPGLRDGSNAVAVNHGPSTCPPGYSLELGCSAYVFTATGWANGWLGATASTQLQVAESIYQGCQGTGYSC